MYVDDYKIGYIRRGETQTVRDILNYYDEVSLCVDAIDLTEVKLIINARMIDHEEF